VPPHPLLRCLSEVPPWRWKGEPDPRKLGEELAVDGVASWVPGSWLVALQQWLGTVEPSLSVSSKVPFALGTRGSEKEPPQHPGSSTLHPYQLRRVGRRIRCSLDGAVARGSLLQPKDGESRQSWASRKRQYKTTARSRRKCSSTAGADKGAMQEGHRRCRAFGRNPSPIEGVVQTL